MATTDTIEPTVFIIESPSTENLREGLVEGEALSSALRLARIRTRYFLVNGLTDLSNSLKEIALLTSPATQDCAQERIVVPLFHFSAHGTEDGFLLTNGELVPWKGLKILLVAIGKATGRISPNGFCLFPVAFSTCSGAHARKMFDGVAPEPCIGIVGPEVPVLWSDALTAYVTLYHLTLTKHVPAEAAVDAMNAAAGLDGVFRCYPHDYVNDRYRKKLIAQAK